MTAMNNSGGASDATFYIDVQPLYILCILKHTTPLFSLSDHYIPSQEYRVIVDQVQTNQHGRHMVL